MIKAKLQVVAEVPFWDFCNNDKLSLKPVATKELCRFCVVDSQGHRRCLLSNEALAEKDGLIYKSPQCIAASHSGFEGTLQEEPQVHIEPKTIIKETVKAYTKTVKSLLNQGYPQDMAEKLTTEYLLKDNSH